MTKVILWTLVLVLELKAPTEACSTIDPVKTWPLGRGILNREILSNEPPEPRGIFNYTSTTLGYDGLLFYGNSSSYVDVAMNGSNVDYSLYFYINPSAHGGCLLHYKSYPSESIGITEYRLDMESDGTLMYSVKTNGVELENGGNVVGTFIVPTNQWSIIIIDFDISKEGVYVTADNWNTYISGDVVDIGSSHVGPGIMRIGSPQDGIGSSFAGGMSCLHYIPDKNVCEYSEYAAKCNENWPTTNSTTTSISTTTPTQTTSISSTTPTQTTTSTSTMTPTPFTSTVTSTTSTSTTTPMPTTESTSSTTPASTTSSTTTPTQLTSSSSTRLSTQITTSTTSTTPTIASTTTPMSTTSSISTTLSTSTTISTSSTTPTPTSTLAPSQPSSFTASPTSILTSATNSISTHSAVLQSAFSSSLNVDQFVQSICRRYNKNSIPTTYADSSDVISVKLVNDVRECLVECGNYAECMAFSLTNVAGTNFYTCKTGRIGAITLFDMDSSLYEVAEFL